MFIYSSNNIVIRFHINFAEKRRNTRADSILMPDNDNDFLSSLRSGIDVNEKLCPLLRYIKVHKATRWTIRHGLMLLWFKDLMNVTEKSQFIDLKFRHSCLVLSSGAI